MLRLILFSSASRFPKSDSSRACCNCFFMAEEDAELWRPGCSLKAGTYPAVLASVSTMKNRREPSLVVTYTVTSLGSGINAFIPVCQLEVNLLSAIFNAAKARLVLPSAKIVSGGNNRLISRDETAATRSQWIRSDWSLNWLKLHCRGESVPPKQRHQYNGRWPNRKRRFPP